MKTYITQITVHDVNPSYAEMLRLGNLFETQEIVNNGKLRIKCDIKMQPYKARFEVAKILNCSLTQIYFTHYEKTGRN